MSMPLFQVYLLALHCDYSSKYECITILQCINFWNIDKYIEIIYKTITTCPPPPSSVDSCLYII